MTINNLLSEMSGPVKTLFHYTNTLSLGDIFNDGYLKGQDYGIGAHNLDKKLEGKEIATIRPSRSNTIDLDSISMGIGNVKFHIFIDKLNDVVKGVKAVPIAEFPMSALTRAHRTIFKKRLEDTMDDKGRHKKIPKDEEKITTAIINLGINKYSDVVKDIGYGIAIKNKKRFEDFKNEAEKISNIKYSVGDFKAIAINITEYKEKIAPKQREGEERIVLKKTEHIPLNPRYMRIELLDGFFNGATYDMYDKSLSEKLKYGFEKYDSIFVKNNEYKKYKEFLEKRKKDGK